LKTNSEKLASLNLEEYTTKQMTNDIKLDNTPNVKSYLLCNIQTIWFHRSTPHLSTKLASLNVEEYTTKQMTNDIKLDKTPNVQKWSTL